MSEIVITPNFERKTARIKGTAAAGEHVSVRIVGAAGLDTGSLRLRAVLFKTTLAVFPLSVESDFWQTDGEDLICTLNLNTSSALKVFRSVMEMEVLFVLDDPYARKLHFSDLATLRGWPQEAGADSPVDLDGYVDFVAEITARMSQAENAIETNASAVQSVMSEKASNEQIAALATKAELAAETEARKSADDAHDERSAAHDAAIDAVGKAVEHAEAHITTHALDDARHICSESFRAELVKTLAEKDYDLSTTDGFVDAVVDIIETLGGKTHD